MPPPKRSANESPISAPRGAGVVSSLIIRGKNQPVSTMNEIQAHIARVSLSKEIVGSDTDTRFAGGGHVSMVFNDGEWSSQKAGSLLWQRHLHCLEGGHPTKRLPIEWFPYQMNGFGYVWCTYEDAEGLRTAIRNSLLTPTENPS